ncbi:TetR/AcrR family transcriptional regulator [Bacillus subtilis]|nr:TetR/AcrR family transcriptional regulator [Bacillus subtilis]
MRPSKRTDILDAALQVIEHGGVTAVTFESVADQAGLTKGGLMYHFPTREALLRGLHEHLAGQWEASLAASAGKPAEDATSAERVAAYARVATSSATRAELLLMLETVNEPDMHQPWFDVLSRWAPPLPDPGQVPPAELHQLIARLAADGLWMNESLTSSPLDAVVRQQIADYLAALTATPEPLTQEDS